MPPGVCREEWGFRLAPEIDRLAPVRRLAALLVLAVTTLVGCTGVPIPPTYTQEELKAECDRHRGWWRPDDLRGGYCDFRGP
jgi:hypothetical protein